MHSEFLDDLLEGGLTTAPECSPGPRCSASISKRCRQVVCLGLLGSREALAVQAAITRRIFNRVDSEVRRDLPGSIVVPRAGDVVVLLATRGAEHAEIHRILSGIVSAAEGDQDRLSAGLGRLCIGLSDYADSYAEACVALDLACRQSRSGEVLSWADLGLFGLLARELPASRWSRWLSTRWLILDADAPTRGTEYVI